MKAAAALLFVAWSCAHAGSLPVTLLATPDAVEQACRQLPDVGITCVPAGSQLSTDALGVGSIPISGAELSFLDRSDHPQVKGFLVLTQMRSTGGNLYYQGAAKLFKTGFAGVGMTTTDLYDRPFWEQVSAFMPFDLPGAPGEQAFLAKMDDQIASDRKAKELRDAAARAAADAAASDARYRASPEFAAAQARERVASCKAAIVRAKSAIAQDDRVAQISGYQNKLVREGAAVTIVNCEDVIARSGR